MVLTSSMSSFLTLSKSFGRFQPRYLVGEMFMWNTPPLRFGFEIRGNLSPDINLVDKKMSENEQVRSHPRHIHRSDDAGCLFIFFAGRFTILLN